MAALQTAGDADYTHQGPHCGTNTSNTQACLETKRHSSPLPTPVSLGRPRCVLRLCACPAAAGVIRYVHPNSACKPQTSFTGRRSHFAKPAAAVVGAICGGDGTFRSGISVSSVKLPQTNHTEGEQVALGLNPPRPRHAGAGATLVCNLSVILLPHHDQASSATFLRGAGARQGIPGYSLLACDLPHRWGGPRFS